MAFLTKSEARQRAGPITKRLRKSAVEALTESISVDETFDVFLRRYKLLDNHTTERNISADILTSTR
jgi:hypothetical protein